GDDPLAALENQLEESQGLFSAISEEKSLHRYAPDKWSIRQVLNHVTDTERAFTFRALWFARGLESPLPSYDQNVAASGAEADRVSWAAHVEEFQRVRQGLSSAMQEEVHQRGNHQQCQQEAKNGPTAASLRSDWGAVVGGHKASAFRVLGLNRAGWLEVLRVTER